LLHGIPSGHQPTIEIRPHEESMRFLYLTTTIINSLAELISRINDGNQVVRIDVAVKLGQVAIGFDHYVASTDMRGLKWLLQVVESIDVEFTNKPVSIKKTELKIVVEFPFEPVPASHESLLYSTVC
jgi:hypothetical protein